MNLRRTAAAPEAPADLLPGRPRGPGVGWHVLHTRSRNEKVLQRLLAGLGIASYLPLRRSVRRSAGRRFERDLPVFPGYLFLWGTREQAFAADRTRRVAGILAVEDQEGLERELANVHRALSAGADLEPYPGLCRGVRVRVASGPLAGVEGLVLSRTAADRLLLQVRMLNTSASLDIGGEALEPIEG